VLWDGVPSRGGYGGGCGKYVVVRLDWSSGVDIVVVDVVVVVLVLPVAAAVRLDLVSAVAVVDLLVSSLLQAALVSSFVLVVEWATPWSMYLPVVEWKTPPRSMAAAYHFVAASSSTLPLLCR
jgi:hypothetical protein